VLAVALAAGTYTASPVATAAPARSAPAADSPADSPADPPADPGHHLSPRLAALVANKPSPGAQAAGQEQLTVPETGPGTLMRTPDGKRVVVELRLASRDAATIDALKAAGARLLPQPADYGRLTVSVLPQDLPAVGDVPGALYVGEEVVPIQGAVCDTTISEGDAILKANQLRAAAGVDGTGVKVGVLSDSFAVKALPATTAAQDVISDNLPGLGNTCGHTSVSTIAEGPAGNADEGRAMMQIVHDLAPGSPVDFATALPAAATMAANITQLANQGAKVIVDDFTYFAEPMYQDGVIEQAVSGVRARGVDYFTDAANNREVVGGHEVGSYEAVNGYRPTTCPAIVAITTGHVDCHNFSATGPDPTFGLTYNGGNRVLRPIIDWAEPWDGGVHTDLDMYLISTTTNTVISTTSQVDNVASQQAVEFLAVSGPSASNLALVVARKSATPPATTPRFKIVFANNGAHPISGMERTVPEPMTGDVMGPTVFGHNGGADAMSVGASSVTTSPSALNDYSSFGPVTILFGPTNGITPAAPLASPLVLAKPDLVANDCNKNSFFGNFSGGVYRFCGTSSAAPHAAAVAALLMQKYPAAPAASINSAMINSATPIAGVPASLQGGGLLNALAANDRLKPVPDTSITKGPKKTVKSKKKKVKVSFKFGSTIAGSTFSCSIDGKAFTACTSGVKYKLKKGKHTFAVRATFDGATDPSPATRSFKIKVKKKKHHH
jgi:hypothetical protein